MSTDSTDTLETASIATALAEDAAAEQEASGPPPEAPEAIAPPEDTTPSEPPSEPPADEGEPEDAPEDESEPEDDSEPEDAPEESADASQEPSAEDRRRLLTWIRDHKGRDLSHKYPTDEAAIDGLLNLEHLLGRRDEDAQIGKVARSLGLDAQQLAQLSQREKPADPAPSKPVVPSYEEMKLIRQEVIDPATGTVREDADPVKLKQIKDYQENSARLLHELQRDPGAVLKDVLDQVTQTVEQQIEQRHQQETAQRHYVDEFQGFENVNASWLYPNGQRPPTRPPLEDGTIPFHPEDYSPAGLEFLQTARELSKEFTEIDPQTGQSYCTVRPYKLAATALKLYQAKQAAQRKPTRKAKGKAQHRDEPAAAAPAAKEMQPPAHMTEDKEIAWQLEQDWRKAQERRGALT